MKPRLEPCSSAIPILVCVDVEPDGFFIDRGTPEPWTGYERAVAFFRDARARIEASGAPPACFTWVFRMDPQVEETYGLAEWAVRHYPTQAAEILAHHDEVGIHPHAYRWDSTARRWISDHGNQLWIERCLDTSFAAFERAFGRPCETFRFGDRWMNERTMEELARRGVAYELTLEPGQPALPSYHPNESFTGSLPDYSRAPTRPYRPAREDYQQPDPARHDGPWVIPMTTASVRPRWMRRAYYRMFRPWQARDIWTAMLSHDPALFRRIIDHALEQQDATHLGIPVRSNAFGEPRLAQRVAANLETLLQHPLARQFVWTTPAETVRILRASL